MQCPVCEKAMVEQDFGGVKVDVCKDGCQGIWFDWFELAKLDETHEGLGQSLEAALQYTRVNDENRGQIKCPKCQIPMHIHKYKSSKEVNVDECYQCAGFFLDSGELQVIRETFMSEEEEKKYMEQLMASVPEFGEAQRDLEKDKLRAEAIRRYTKYLRVSYYVKGS